MPPLSCHGGFRKCRKCHNFFILLGGVSKYLFYILVGGSFMNILDAVLGVFSAIGEWIAGAVVDLIPMFYVAETGLTLLGVLAVAGLAFSVVFLIIGLIQNFLHFRG